MDRRGTLKLGLAGLAGGSFFDLLALRKAAAKEADSSSRAYSNCILIWLDGGPSHLETFDMKPEAPVEIRGEFKPIKTNVPGIEICEHLPKLAKIGTSTRSFDRFAITKAIMGRAITT